MGIHFVTRGQVTEYRAGLPDVRRQAPVNGPVEFKPLFPRQCTAILFQAFPQALFLLSDHQVDYFLPQRTQRSQSGSECTLCPLWLKINCHFLFYKKAVQYYTFSDVQLNLPFGRDKVCLW